MKLSFGSDHGGKQLRDELVTSFQAQGFEVIDHGTHETASVDYPDFAIAVAKDVSDGTTDFGVLVCTTGIGISISANKVKGIRAALVRNEDAAEFSRLHNNANIICFGGKYDTPYLAEKMIKKFISTKYEGGRHQQRVDKISTEEQCG